MQLLLHLVARHAPATPQTAHRLERTVQVHDPLAAGLAMQAVDILRDQVVNMTDRFQLDQRAVRAGTVTGDTPDAQLQHAHEREVIDEAEYELLCRADAARRDAIQVDDFPPETFGRRG